LVRTRKTYKRALRALAKEYILQNPYASVAQAATAVGASEKTISNARAELIKLGLVERHPDNHRTQGIGTIKRVGPVIPDEPEKLEKVTARQLMDEVEREVLVAGTSLERDLDPVEMKQILSRLARNPMIAPQVRIAAVTAKTKLDFETQDRHTLGPGKPMTRAGAEDRMSMMMKALGLEITVSAFEKTFNWKGVSSDETTDGESAIPPGITETPSETRNESSEEKVESVWGESMAV